MEKLKGCVLMKQDQLSLRKSPGLNSITFDQIELILIAKCILPLLKVSTFFHGMCIKVGVFKPKGEKKVLQYTVSLIYRLVITLLLALDVFFRMILITNSN